MHRKARGGGLGDVKRDVKQAEFPLARLGGPGVWNDALFLGLLGTAVGTSQWWILRQHYRKAGLGVLATARMRSLEPWRH